MTPILNGTCTSNDLREAAAFIRAEVHAGGWRHGYTSQAAALEAAEELDRDADAVDAQEATP